MSVVEAFNVSKRFGKIIALENVNLSFNNGVYGLVGPNGSGKTTFIRIMLGLQKPSSGRILVFGKDPFYSHDEVFSKIGYLREKCAFPKWVTGIDYLRHVAKLKQVDLDQNVIHHSVVKGDFLERKIGTYSAGMVQRLGLLQALIGDPSLIILDEPSTNLDPLGRVEMVKLIQEIKRHGGKSIIVSTHILEELEQICDFIIVMDKGKIIAQDTLGKFIKSFSLDGTLVNAYARIMGGAQV
ncbi:MAG: ABC transporter ATP-binding protein [Candidatus Brockarchaeota archaeon]|nr:ABC transporter ATP-binding protein [Candidatus Brockarchaeota archaeon]